MDGGWMLWMRLRTGWRNTCFSSLMDWIRSMRISFSRSSSSPAASSSGSTPSSSGPLLLPRAVGLLFCNREVTGLASPSRQVGSVLVGREKVACTALGEISSAVGSGLSEGDPGTTWGPSGWLVVLSTGGHQANRPPPACTSRSLGRAGPILQGPQGLRGTPACTAPKTCRVGPPTVYIPGPPHRGMKTPV